jgi:hypothetical protein
MSRTEDGRSLGRNLNSRPIEYEAGLLNYIESDVRYVGQLFLDTDEDVNRNDFIGY